MTWITPQNRFNYLIQLLLPSLIVIAMLFALKNNIQLVIFIFLIFLLVSWLISKYELQTKFLMLLALMLPFSVEYNIASNLIVRLPTEPMLGIAILSIFWDGIMNKGHFVKLFAGETLWIIPFMGSYIIVSFFSEIPIVSLKFSIINCSYILVFFIWQKRYFKVFHGLFEKLMLLYSLSFIVVLVYAIVNYSNFNWNPISVKGIFKPFYSDHTILGATSGLLSMFWISYLIKKLNPTLKLLSLLMGSVFVLAVIFSHSRAAFLSLLFSSMVWIVLGLKIRARYLFVGILTLSVSLFVLWPTIYEVMRLNTKLSHNPTYTYVDQIQSSTNISSDVSNIERLNRWSAGLTMFIDRPITGFGPGTYQFEYIPFQKQYLINRLSVFDPWHVPENSGGTAHSEYILVLSEMGLIGFLTLLLFMCRWGWMIFFNHAVRAHRAILIIAGVSLASYFFHAFFNNFLNTDKFAFLFWGTAAWMVGHFELQQHG